MFNAQSKLIAIAAVAAAACCSCGKSQSESPAEILYNEAEQAFLNGHYTTATALLDSLDKDSSLPASLRRQSMALRPRIFEQQTLLLISQADSVAAANTALNQRIADKMRWVKTPGMIEGYHVASDAYNPAFLNSTGLEARVSEIGQFYVVSSVNPGNIHYHSATLRIGGDEATAGPVAYDGELNYRINSSEVVTYSPEMSDTIGHLASLHPDSPSVIILSGDKGNKTINLNAKQTRAIADAYLYSRSIIDARDAAARREHLNRQLELARSQIARTIPEIE